MHVTIFLYVLGIQCVETCCILSLLLLPLSLSRPSSMVAQIAVWQLIKPFSSRSKIIFLTQNVFIQVP